MSRNPADSRGKNAVFSERAVGGTYLDIDINRDAVARYGMTVDDVESAFATATGGMDAGQIIAGRERCSVLVRYSRELRDMPEKIANVLIATPSGAQVALGALARIVVTNGPTLIKSENATLNNIVYVDVRGRDVGGYVAEGRALLARQLTLPSG